MKLPRLKLGAKQHLPIVHIPKHLQRIRVGRILPQNRPRLQHELVRTKVRALQESQLVLVREIQRAHGVFQDAEVQGLDAGCARVCAVVAGGEELRPAEGGLAVED